MKDVSEDVRYREYRKKASMREEACLVKIMSIQRLCPIMRTTLFYYASDILLYTQLLIIKWIVHRNALQPSHELLRVMKVN